MFVQICEGDVTDAELFRRQMDRWERELRPGANGFLGATAGVTDNSYGVAFARFESAAAARANSERPEQGDWWSETEKAFGGAPTFAEADGDDVELLLDGGSNAAGFVQLMRGTADRDRLHEMDEIFTKIAPTFRPDLIGGFRVWTGPNAYTDVAYFTSEAEAREAEKKEPPAEMAAAMDKFGDLMQGIEFLDLRDPWLY